MAIENREQLLQMLQMLQIQQEAEQNPIDFSPFSMQRMAGEKQTSSPTNQGIVGSPSGLGVDQSTYSGTEISPEASQRAKGAGLAGVGKVGASMGKNAVLGGMMGFDPMEVATMGIKANPASVLGIGPAMGYAQAGIHGPGGFKGGLMGMAPAALAAALGLTGPLGAAVGMIGTPFADMMGDYFGVRDLDDVRDDVEGELGQLDGRGAYADAMAGVKEHSPETLGTLDESNPASVRDAIGKTRGRMGTSKQMTPANLDMNVNLSRLTEALQDLQDRMSRSQSISGIGNVGTTSANSSGGFGVGNTSAGGMSAGFGSGMGSGMSAGLGPDAGTGRFDYGGAVDDWGGFGGDNDNSGRGNDNDGSTGRAGGPDSDAESTGF